ncbi:hypothetical protein DPMN_012967 [Dreissena polymorpha]|uniref:Uncharacterized protein n=2 Tax=Dreissena polymorpha TaxID=45954 RepID=A0A9D4N3F1_DREPO|nr:hypothetical protein DPMN_012967 [Dreissena polymorpha]
MYTFACLSGICSIIPMTDVLSENEKLQERNNLKFQSPYSLVMFGIGGFSMILVASLSVVSNWKKCLPLGALTFPYVDQTDQNSSPNTTALTDEKNDNNCNNTVDHVRRKRINKAMVLIISGLIVSNVLTIISLATTGWIKVKDINCEQIVKYGLFSSDLCDECSLVPECRNAIEFTESVKVKSLLAYFFNLFALAAAFINRPPAWRGIRAMLMFVFLTCQLFSAVFTINVAVHVLIIPQEQLDKSVVVSYSLYIYGVASLLSLTTSLVTITYVIHNRLPENHGTSTDNTISNAAIVVIDANRQEHTKESASAMFVPEMLPTNAPSAYLALSFDDTQEHVYGCASGSIMSETSPVSDKQNTVGAASSNVNVNAVSNTTTTDCADDTLGHDYEPVSRKIISTRSHTTRGHSNTNAISTSNLIVDDGNASEHVYELEEATISAIPGEYNHRNATSNAVMTADDGDRVKYSYELIPITILKQGEPKDGFVKMYTKKDTLAPPQVPSNPSERDYELYF